MNDWSPLYKQTYAPHAKNGSLLKATDPNDNTGVGGASSAEIGATGGNVGLLDGSVTWKKIQQMYQNYWTWSEDGGHRGAW